MPQTGPISCHVYSPPNDLMRREWRCSCGAQADSVDVSTPDNPRPVTVPGALLEECTCPKCITCAWVLDNEGRCDNLDCPLIGVLIVVPD